METGDFKTDCQDRSMGKSQFTARVVVKIRTKIKVRGDR